MDLVRAFKKIPAGETGIPKTALTTLPGLFKFVRIPFGLSNATLNFQRFTHEVTRSSEDFYACLDDILVGGHSAKQHPAQLHALSDQLSVHDATINDWKYDLGKPSVTFLGQTDEVLAPFLDKVTAVWD